MMLLDFSSKMDSRRLGRYFKMYPEAAAPCSPSFTRRSVYLEAAAPCTWRRRLCVYVCMCVCVYACMCTCVHVYIYHDICI